jgi:3-oxoacyl-[acyl-carrier-protein] synthase-3
MDGPRVYKMAIRRVLSVFKRLFTRCGVRIEDIQWVIPHQASGKAVTAYSKYGGFRPEVVINRVREEGNCVAASTPLALDYAHQQGLLRRGDLVLVCGTGAGLSVIALLLRW